MPIPTWAVDQTFDLFDKLGATDEQLDFPIVYASGLNGWAAMELDQPRENMKPLFDTVLKHVPAPDTDINAPLQLQITALDYSSYVGRIGVGKINRGKVKTGQQVLVMFGTEEEAVEHERTPIKAKIGQVLGLPGPEQGRTGRRPRWRHRPDHRHRRPGARLYRYRSGTIRNRLPLLKIDEPTLTMQFMVNTSRWPVPKASSSPAARSVIACTRNC